MPNSFDPDRFPLYRHVGVIGAIFIACQSAFWFLMSFIAIMCYFGRCGKEAYTGTFEYCFYRIYLHEDGGSYINYLKPKGFISIMVIYMLLSILTLLISVRLLWVFFRWTYYKEEIITKTSYWWTRVILVVAILEVIIFFLFYADIIVIKYKAKKHCDLRNFTFLSADEFNTNFTFLENEEKKLIGAQKILKCLKKNLEYIDAKNPASNIKRKFLNVSFNNYANNFWRQMLQSNTRENFNTIKIDEKVTKFIIKHNITIEDVDFLIINNNKKSKKKRRRHARSSNLSKGVFYNFFNKYLITIRDNKPISNKMNNPFVVNTNEKIMKYLKNIQENEGKRRNDGPLIEPLLNKFTTQSAAANNFDNEILVNLKKFMHDIHETHSTVPCSQQSTYSKFAVAKLKALVSKWKQFLEKTTKLYQVETMTTSSQKSNETTTLSSLEKNILRKIIKHLRTMIAANSSSPPTTLSDLSIDVKLKIGGLMKYILSRLNKLNNITTSSELENTTLVLNENASKNMLNSATTTETTNLNSISSTLNKNNITASKSQEETLIQTKATTKILIKTSNTEKSIEEDLEEEIIENLNKNISDTLTTTSNFLELNAVKAVQALKEPSTIPGKTAENLNEEEENLALVLNEKIEEDTTTEKCVETTKESLKEEIEKSNKNLADIYTSISNLCEQNFAQSTQALKNEATTENPKKNVDCSTESNIIPDKYTDNTINDDDEKPNDLEKYLDCICPHLKNKNVLTEINNQLLQAEKIQNAGKDASAAVKKDETSKGIKPNCVKIKLKSEDDDSTAATSNFSDQCENPVTDNIIDDKTIILTLDEEILLNLIKKIETIHATTSSYEKISENDQSTTENTKNVKQLTSVIAEEPKNLSFVHTTETVNEDTVKESKFQDKRTAHVINQNKTPLLISDENILKNLKKHLKNADPTDNDKSTTQNMEDRLETKIMSTKKDAKFLHPNSAHITQTTVNEEDTAKDFQQKTTKHATDKINIDKTSMALLDDEGILQNLKKHLKNAESTTDYQKTSDDKKSSAQNIEDDLHDHLEKELISTTKDLKFLHPNSEHITQTVNAKKFQQKSTNLPIDDIDIDKISMALLDDEGILQNLKKHLKNAESTMDYQKTSDDKKSSTQHIEDDLHDHLEKQLMSTTEDLKFLHPNPERITQTVVKAKDFQHKSTNLATDDINIDKGILQNLKKHLENAEFTTNYQETSDHKKSTTQNIEDDLHDHLEKQLMSTTKDLKFLHPNPEHITQTVKKFQKKSTNLPTDNINLDKISMALLDDEGILQNLKKHLKNTDYEKISESKKSTTENLKDDLLVNFEKHLTKTTKEPKFLDLNPVHIAQTINEDARKFQHTILNPSTDNIENEGILKNLRKHLKNEETITIIHQKTTGNKKSTTQNIEENILDHLKKQVPKFSDPNLVYASAQTRRNVTVEESKFHDKHADLDAKIKKDKIPILPLKEDILQNLKKHLKNPETFTENNQKTSDEKSTTPNKNDDILDHLKKQLANTAKEEKFLEINSAHTTKIVNEETGKESKFLGKNTDYLKSSRTESKIQDKSTESIVLPVDKDILENLKKHLQNAESSTKNHRADEDRLEQSKITPNLGSFAHTTQKLSKNSKIQDENTVFTINILNDDKTTILPLNEDIVKNLKKHLDQTAAHLPNPTTTTTKNQQKTSDEEKFTITKITNKNIVDDLKKHLPDETTEILNYEDDTTRTKDEPIIFSMDEGVIENLKKHLDDIFIHLHQEDRTTTKNHKNMSKNEDHLKHTTKKRSTENFNTVEKLKTVLSPEESILKNLKTHLEDMYTHLQNEEETTESHKQIVDDEKSTKKNLDANYKRFESNTAKARNFFDLNNLHTSQIINTDDDSKTMSKLQALNIEQKQYMDQTTTKSFRKNINEDIKYKGNLQVIADVPDLVRTTKSPREENNLEHLKQELQDIFSKFKYLKKLKHSKEVSSKEEPASTNNLKEELLKKIKQLQQDINDASKYPNFHRAKNLKENEENAENRVENSLQTTATTTSSAVEVQKKLKQLLILDLLSKVQNVMQTDQTPEKEANKVTTASNIQEDILKKIKQYLRGTAASSKLHKRKVRQIFYEDSTTASSQLKKNHYLRDLTNFELSNEQSTSDSLLEVLSKLDKTQIKDDDDQKILFEDPARILTIPELKKRNLVRTKRNGNFDADMMENFKKHLQNIVIAPKIEENPPTEERTTTAVPNSDKDMMDNFKNHLKNILHMKVLEQEYHTETNTEKTTNQIIAKDKFFMPSEDKDMVENLKYYLKDVFNLQLPDNRDPAIVRSTFKQNANRVTSVTPSLEEDLLKNLKKHILQFGAVPIAQEEDSFRNTVATVLQDEDERQIKSAPILEADILKNFKNNLQDFFAGPNLRQADLIKKNANQKTIEENLSMSIIDKDMLENLKNQLNNILYALNADLSGASTVQITDKKTSSDVSILQKPSLEEDILENIKNTLISNVQAQPQENTARSNEENRVTAPNLEKSMLENLKKQLKDISTEPKIQNLFQTTVKILTNIKTSTESSLDRDMLYNFKKHLEGILLTPDEQTTKDVIQKNDQLSIQYKDIMQIETDRKKTTVPSFQDDIFENFKKHLNNIPILKNGQGSMSENSTPSSLEMSMIDNLKIKLKDILYVLKQQNDELITKPIIPCNKEKEIIEGMLVNLKTFIQNIPDVLTDGNEERTAQKFGEEMVTAKSLLKDDVLNSFKTQLKDVYDVLKLENVDVNTKSTTIEEEEENLGPEKNMLENLKQHFKSGFDVPKMPDKNLLLKYSTNIYDEEKTTGLNVEEGMLANLKQHFKSKLDVPEIPDKDLMVKNSKDFIQKKIDEEKTTVPYMEDNMLANLKQHFKNKLDVPKIPEKESPKDVFNEENYTIRSRDEDNLANIKTYIQKIPSPPNEDLIQITTKQIPEEEMTVPKLEKDLLANLKQHFRNEMNAPKMPDKNTPGKENFGVLSRDEDILANVKTYMQNIPSAPKDLIETNTKQIIDKKTTTASKLEEDMLENLKKQLKNILDVQKVQNEDLIVNSIKQIPDKETYTILNFEKDLLENIKTHVQNIPSVTKPEEVIEKSTKQIFAEERTTVPILEEDMLVNLKKQLKGILDVKKMQNEDNTSPKRTKQIPDKEEHKILHIDEDIYKNMKTYVENIPSVTRSYKDLIQTSIKQIINEDNVPHLEKDMLENLKKELKGILNIPKGQTKNFMPKSTKLMFDNEKYSVLSWDEDILKNIKTYGHKIQPTTRPQQRESTKKFTKQINDEENLPVPSLDEDILNNFKKQLGSIAPKTTKPTSNIGKYSVPNLEKESLGNLKTYMKNFEAALEQQKEDSAAQKSTTQIIDEESASVPSFNEDVQKNLETHLKKIFQATTAVYLTPKIGKPSNTERIFTVQGLDTTTSSVYETKETIPNLKEEDMLPKRKSYLQNTAAAPLLQTEITNIYGQDKVSSINLDDDSSAESRKTYFDHSITKSGISPHKNQMRTYTNQRRKRRKRSNIEDDLYEILNKYNIEQLIYNLENPDESNRGSRLVEANDQDTVSSKTNFKTISNKVDTNVKNNRKRFAITQTATTKANINSIRVNKELLEKVKQLLTNIGHRQNLQTTVSSTTKKLVPNLNKDELRNLLMNIRKSNIKNESISSSKVPGTENPVLSNMNRKWSSTRKKKNKMHRNLSSSSQKPTTLIAEDMKEKLLEYLAKLVARKSADKSNSQDENESGKMTTTDITYKTPLSEDMQKKFLYHLKYLKDLDAFQRTGEPIFRKDIPFFLLVPEQNELSTNYFQHVTHVVRPSKRDERLETTPGIPDNDKSIIDNLMTHIPTIDDALDVNLDKNAENGNNTENGNDGNSGLDGQGNDGNNGNSDQDGQNGNNGNNGHGDDGNNGNSGKDGNGNNGNNGNSGKDGNGNNGNNGNSGLDGHGDDGNNGNSGKDGNGTNGNNTNSDQDGHGNNGNNGNSGLDGHGDDGNNGNSGKDEDGKDGKNKKPGKDGHGNDGKNSDSDSDSDEYADYVQGDKSWLQKPGKRDECDEYDEMQFHMRALEITTDICENCEFWLLFPSMFCMILAIKTGLVWIVNVALAFIFICLETAEEREN